MQALLPRALPILTTTTSTRIGDRHYTDPPKLWQSLIVASILVHLFGLGLVQLLMMRQNGVTSKAVPVGIELITDNSKITTRSPQPPTKSLPQNRTNQVATATPKKPAIPSPAPQAQTSPLKLRSQPKVLLPTSARQPAPGLKITPKTPSKIATVPREVPPTIPKKSEPPKTVTPSVPPTPPQTASSPPVAPYPSPPLQKPQFHEETPAKKVSPAQEGSGMMATLFEVHLANGGKDIPDKPAKPKKEKKEFSSILYPAKQGQKSDGLLVLRVLLLIDNTGKPTIQSAKVLQGNASFNTDEFVKGLIQDWQFEPAYSAGQAVDSLLEASIKISPMTN
jgi:hypothetical protein